MQTLRVKSLRYYLALIVWFFREVRWISQSAYPRVHPLHGRAYHMDQETRDLLWRRYCAREPKKPRREDFR